IASTLGGGGHDLGSIPCLDVVVVFRRKPKKCSIFFDRPAHRAAAQIVRAAGLGKPSLIAEVVVRQPPNRTRLEEASAAERVRSALQRRVEDSAAGAAHF